MALENEKVAFLGYGNMAEAIVTGLLNQRVIPAERVYAYDPMPSRRAAATGKGIVGVDQACDLLTHCSVLILAVKPQQSGEAIRPLLEGWKSEVLVISIMAGIVIQKLEKWFGKQTKILRVMPNTPALVGAGASVIAKNELCSEYDLSVARSIFESVGMVEIVPESWLDVVTALSGSGPAYYFYLTECLSDAARAEGLPETLAEKLAAQTFYGSGKLLLESGLSAADLREKVTSKGGTTFAALEKMRSRDFREIIHEAIIAAAARSRALGQDT